MRPLLTAALLFAVALPAAGGPSKHLGPINARPVWSPNGRLIAFQSNTGPRPHGTEMWVMSATGSMRRDLGEGGGFATWSPDGKRVAFSNYPTIVVVRRDGTHRHQFPGGESPRWSSRNRIAYEGDGGIHVVRPDGSHDQILAADGSVPEWFPDGSRLAFLLDGNVWRIDADGSNARRMTTLAPPYEVRSFALSRDGSAIAFTVGYRVIYPNPPSQPFELWRADGDGGNPSMLVHYQPGGSSLADPTWSPSSGVIAFFGDLYSRHRRFDDIFRIGRAGGSARNVTRSPRRVESDPDWGKSGRITFSNWRDIYTIDANGRGLRNLTRHR